MWFYIIFTFFVSDESVCFREEKKKITCYTHTRQKLRRTCQHFVLDLVEGKFYRTLHHSKVDFLNYLNLIFFYIHSPSLENCLNFCNKFLLENKKKFFVLILHKFFNVLFRHASLSSVCNYFLINGRVYIT